MIISIGLRNTILAKREYGHLQSTVIATSKICVNSTTYPMKCVVVVLDRNFEALIPKSTRPKCSGTMQTDPRIVSFIRQVQTEHPHLGSTKLSILLDVFCHDHRLATLSLSTIGELIRHDPNYRRLAGKLPRPAANIGQNARGLPMRCCRKSRGILSWIQLSASIPA